MKTQEVNESLIGKKVSGVLTGMEVTGIVIGIVKDFSLTSKEICSIGVRIKLDKPVRWGYDIFSEYESTARVSDDWGNLQHTKIIE